MNDNDIKILESDLPELAKPNKKATAITKTDRMRYSALKKAIAPSAILEPIDIILSVP